MSDDIHDLFIVGGGINGAGIARDAAGQGLKVLLCDAGDLGGATSSASSKLIHGGLRYLEHGEFRLVRDALRERQTLLRIAPHIVSPLRFVMPHVPGLRPAWMIRLGLFLYDHLARRGPLRGSRGLNLRTAPEGAPLKDTIRKGFAYSDCWVDDARLVILNCRDAADRGAEILPRTACTSARQEDGLWEATLEDGRTIRARALVNATGPWAGDLDRAVLGAQDASHVRRVKGSHIVVDRLYDGDHAYILQNPDRRVVFAIPYEGRFTMIGTTEEAFDGNPRDAAISADETAYLLDTVARFFKSPASEDAIRWRFAGVRPLYDDGTSNASAVTRDYVFDLVAEEGSAPRLSIVGGKLTTYRKLADHALSLLLPKLGRHHESWTADAPLPGGDIADADFAAFRAELGARRPALPAALLDRFAHAYGSRIDGLLGDARDIADLGEDFGAGLHRREVDFLRETEWATSAEDILWRRTKLGLHIGDEGMARLAACLDGDISSP